MEKLTAEQLILQRLHSIKKTQLELVDDRCYDISQDRYLLTISDAEFVRRITQIQKTQRRTPRQLLANTYRSGNKSLLVYYGDNKISIRKKPGPEQGKINSRTSIDVVRQYLNILQGHINTERSTNPLFDKVRTYITILQSIPSADKTIAITDDIGTYMDEAYAFTRNDASVTDLLGELDNHEQMANDIYNLIDIVEGYNIFENRVLNDIRTLIARAEEYMTTLQNINGNVDNAHNISVTAEDIRIKSKKYIKELNEYRESSPVIENLIDMIGKYRDLAKNIQVNIDKIDVFDRIPGYENSKTVNDYIVLLQSFITNESNKYMSTIFIIAAKLPAKAANLYKLFFLTNKMKNQIYFEEDLTFNPTQHISVPVHEYLYPEEADIKLKQMKTSPIQLPLIKSNDPIVRYYGWVDGDIIKIYRYDDTVSILGTRSINYRRVTD